MYYVTITIRKTYTQTHEQAWLIIIEHEMGSSARQCNDFGIGIGIACNRSHRALAIPSLFDA